MTGTQPSRHRCQVLVVDNDAAVRELLTVALESEGYGVSSVEDGRQALHHLRSHAETCVIVLELVLPVMDGRQFRDIQQRDRSLAWIPVIAMSAVAEGDRRAREIGARAYLRKPLNLDELRQALRRVGSCRVRSRAAVEW